MSKRNVRQQLQTLLATRTQAQLAKLLGVNERTIRRWKNEGSVPKKERAQRLTKTVSRERAKIKQRQTHFYEIDPDTKEVIEGPIEYVELPIQVEPYRLLKKSVITKKYYLSASVYIDVDRYTTEEIIMILQALVDSRKYHAFSIQYRTPISPEYPYGMRTMIPTETESREGPLEYEEIADIIYEEIPEDAHGMRHVIQRIVLSPPPLVVVNKKRRKRPPKVRR